MSDDHENVLNQRLDKLYFDALAALVHGKESLCLQILDAPYSSDELLELHGVEDTSGFADALKSIGGSDDLESALETVTSERVMLRQCQLDLLKALVALSRREVTMLLRALADLCDRASFFDRLERQDDDAVERIAEAAMALNIADDSSCARLALWRAKRHAANRSWLKASRWLERAFERIDASGTGPLEESARRLKREVAAHWSES